MGLALLPITYETRQGYYDRQRLSDNERTLWDYLFDELEAEYQEHQSRKVKAATPPLKPPR